jgi:hypothetical protein
MKCVIHHKSSDFSPHFQCWAPEMLQGMYVCYYMVSITSGEMADYDWLKSTFSGPLTFNKA